jgi:hypothetical protein
MNVTAMGKAGLTGAKGMLGHRIAPAIADATSLSEEQALALIGALFLALTLYQTVRTLKRVWRAGQEAS